MQRSRRRREDTYGGEELGSSVRRPDVCPEYGGQREERK